MSGGNGSGCGIALGSLGVGVDLAPVLPPSPPRGVGLLGALWVPTLACGWPLAPLGFPAASGVLLGSACRCLLSLPAVALLRLVPFLSLGPSLCLCACASLPCRVPCRVASCRFFFFVGALSAPFFFRPVRGLVWSGRSACPGALPFLGLRLSALLGCCGVAPGLSLPAPPPSPSPGGGGVWSLGGPVGLSPGAVLVLCSCPGCPAGPWLACLRAFLLFFPWALAPLPGLPRLLRVSAFAGLALPALPLPPPVPSGRWSLLPVTGGGVSFFCSPGLASSGCSVSFPLAAVLPWPPWPGVVSPSAGSGWVSPAPGGGVSSGGVGSVGPGPGLPLGGVGGVCRPWAAPWVVAGAGRSAPPSDWLLWLTPRPDHMRL
jgi:hypothetical protein